MTREDNFETDLELYTLLGKITANIECVNDKTISKERAYERIKECVEKFNKMRRGK